MSKKHHKLLINDASAEFGQWFDKFCTPIIEAMDFKDDLKPWVLDNGDVISNPVSRVVAGHFITDYSERKNKSNRSVFYQYISVATMSRCQRSEDQFKAEFLGIFKEFMKDCSTQINISNTNSVGRFRFGYPTVELKDLTWYISISSECSQKST